MNIQNLAERQMKWAYRGNRGPITGHDLVDSLPYPFEDANIQTVFDNKDVLEIGPGNGRQYERLCGVVKTYCIADISADALAEPAFEGVAVEDRFLLADWRQQLGKVFDVVHFWYVLHHIVRAEMTYFFEFVSRHLRDGGLVAFNSPEPQNVQGPLEGDGIGTTYSDPDVVREVAPQFEVLVSASIQRKSTGHVFLMRKR